MVLRYLAAEGQVRVAQHSADVMIPVFMARHYQLKGTRSLAKSGIDYAEKLNAQQHAAVISPPGKALVIAGAGSGKTRTLTYRVAWLLDQGLRPQEILLLTFTNKAAREMKEGVAALVPHAPQDLWAGTFHSIGSRILRRHAEVLGFTSAFTILDRDDQKSMLNKVIAECKFTVGERRFPKADLILSLFSLADNMDIPLDELIHARYEHHYQWLEEILIVREKYSERKLATNSMDFDDLLLKTTELLEKNPSILAIYQKRFLHVLVDEYQDTNSVQGRMIDCLVGPEHSLMAVGDDAQSIYSWRGAEVKYILEFQHRYPAVTIFTIEKNYRSVPEILELSNAAIGMNQGRYEKELQAARPSNQVKPALIALGTPHEQAAFVSQRIQELIETGTSLNEIAVLYRAHFHSMEVQMRLTAHGIPFEITSGIRFFEQAHIKDICSFLRFVVNRRDEVSFSRMVSLMPGCGPKNAERLWNLWLASGWSRDEKPPHWSKELINFKVPQQSKPHWKQLLYVLDEMTPGGIFATTQEMITSVLEGVYDDYLKQSYENDEARRADIHQFSQYAETVPDVTEFLSQLSLLSSIDGEPKDIAQDVNEERVTLSSIHQAKGLEWKVVFVIWLADGHFPHTRILESMDNDLLEEERRVYYVAITRAKDELYLSYPMSNPRPYDAEMICQPSRFLLETPENLVEIWNVSEDDEPF